MALKGLKITALAATTLVLLYSSHVAYAISMGKAAPHFLLSFVPVVISSVSSHLLRKQETAPPAGSTTTVIPPLDDMPELPDTPREMENFLRDFHQTVFSELPPFKYIQEKWEKQLAKDGWTVKGSDNGITILDKSGNKVVDLYVEIGQGQLSIRSEYVMPQLPLDKDKARAFLAGFKPCTVLRRNELQSDFVDRHWGTQLKVFGWIAEFSELDRMIICDENNKQIVKLKFKIETDKYSIESDKKES